MRSLLFILLFFALGANAQEVEIKISENLIPNPSFEKYSATPVGWFYKGIHFTKVMRDWDSPTLASPDVFGPKVRVPQYWREKGFGNIKAYDGSSLSGITIYGCDDGKPHCREYLQAQLIEPMVVGQKYRVSFRVKSLKNSLQCNNIGVAFSKGRTYQNDDHALPLNAVFNHSQIVFYNDRWIEISGEFIAKDNDTHIILGNFYSDEDTETKSPQNMQLNYSYYYVDDIKLKKEKPILEVPKPRITWKDQEVKTGDLISLQNIFFDTDKADLLSSSFAELDRLVLLLNTYPNMEIEIYGHTDAQGEHQYNVDLSWRRAESVKRYLQEQGINDSRLRYKGFGEGSPVADNSTNKGRQLNRRVEFKILDM